MPKLMDNVVQPLLDALPDAIFLVDAGGALQGMNRRAETMFGYTSDQLTGRPLACLLPERFRAGLDSCTAAFFADFGPAAADGVRTELVALHGSGEEFPVDVLLSRMSIEERQLLVASVRDVTERKRAEESARNSEARHRALLKGLPDLIFILNSDAIFLDYHTPDSSLLWMPPERFLGRPVSEVMPPDLARQIEVTIGEALRADETQRLEYVLAIGESQPRHFEARIIPTKEGTVTAVARDVTERKAVEEAVRRSERRLQTIIDAEPACVKVVSPDGILLEINRAGLEMVGAERPEQIVGRPVADLVHPADRETLREVHLAASRGVPGRQAFRVVGLNGCERWVDSHLVALETTSAINPAVERSVLSVTSDITERIRAEEALHASEERMRFALEVSRLGVWEANLKTGAAYWSETCEVLHGLERGAFGKSFQAFIDRIHPEDREQVLRTAQRAIAERRDVEFEYRTTWPDGTERRISTTASFSYDETGEPLRGAGVSIDVTEQRALEAHLRQANKMEAIGQLAGGIAHDFNNLLTAIGGFTELVLLTMDETDAQRANLLEVQKATARAATLTRQLLAFSRGQFLRPMVLDLNTLVLGVEQLLHRTLGENINLVLTLDPELERVQVDPGHFEQVLLNLALNARDAMPHGGQLRFVTEMVDIDRPMPGRRAPVPPGRYVRLTVADTGTGMAPDIQSHIFEPFFTTKEPDKGTGLGLATVYGIVSQSHGFVLADSQVGVGTSFEIFLPVTPEAVERHERREPTSPATGGSETILLAEDDRAVRQFARQALTRSGYTVLEARDGEEALRVLHSDRGRRIGLLVTDVIMPGVGGHELAVQLARQRPNIRVLYTSGYAESLKTRPGIEQGTPFLSKPFQRADLLQKVREALDTPAESMTNALSGSSSEQL